MYVKIVDNAVEVFPYSTKQLVKDNPNVSFPSSISDELLESYGVYPVVTSDPPTYNERTQHVTNSASPVLQNGVWTLTSDVVQKSDESIASFDENVLYGSTLQRDSCLIQSDWTQMNDSPLSNELKTAWATYRQALRDITTHANWPNLNEADWPVKPA